MPRRHHIGRVYTVLTPNCLISLLTIVVLSIAPVKGQPLHFYAQRSEIQPQHFTQLHWLNGEEYFTVLDAGAIVKYRAADLNPDEVVFRLPGHGIDLYRWSPDETKILYAYDKKPIYRYSFTAIYGIYDVEAQMDFIIDSTPILNVTWSPDGKHFAYVKDNNIYIYDVEGRNSRAITSDGRALTVSNGLSDWVYEEEFSLVRALEWSPDGKKLLFLRFDQRSVPIYALQFYRHQLYPQPYRYRYPRVGQPNSRVTAIVYDVRSARFDTVLSTGEHLEYIPRLGWTPTGQMWFYGLNRKQDDLRVILVDTQGRRRVLLRETAPTYVEVHDFMSFSSDGRYFLWLSSRTGFAELYLGHVESGALEQLTREGASSNEVTDVHFSERWRDTLYYTATAHHGIDRVVKLLDVPRHRATQWSCATGSHGLKPSPSAKYTLYWRSSVHTPPRVGIYRKGESPLYDDRYGHSSCTSPAGFQYTGVQFLRLPNGYGDSLNAWVWFPDDFDTTQPHPLVLYVYGGPGSQTVRNRAGVGQLGGIHAALVRHGIVVASVDNRGTGGRGARFKDCTYGQLSHYEVSDQVAAARYFAQKPWINPNAIAIWGWSYGGYMALKCLFADTIFSAAAAVAPVTDWRWYDNIYTERYMNTLEANPEGYRQSSVLSDSAKFRGRLLLIHGMADDNVHFQHSAELARLLINSHCDVQFYAVPNENHGFSKEGKVLWVLRKVTEFLIDQLLLKPNK